MAKRKFGASIIILCIAAITLISGTYAWFLVGGFAELFDIGFDVIEAKGGILLRGDAGTYGGGKHDNNGWGDSLDRVDFREMSFIVKDGRYKPISTNNGERFIAVTMESDKFICDGVVKGKTDDGILAEDICYNDFTFYIKSTADEIVATDNGKGAYIKLKLTGDTFDDQGNVVKPENENEKGASIAGRISLTFDGKTTIYAIDNEDYNAVTQVFESRTITDAEVSDGEGNYIIDSRDENYSTAGLVPISPVAMLDNDGNEIKISLGNVPGVDQDYGVGAGNGKEITIRIWLEGNDPDCIAFGEGAVAGKSLMSYISFGVDE